MDGTNSENLTLLLTRLERVRKVLGAKQLSMAGVLPSFLAQRSSGAANGFCTDYTAQAVRQAVHEVRRDRLNGQAHEIVILGGAGRVGRAVRSMLHQDGIETTVIDPALPGSSEHSGLPAGPTPPVILLIDVSRHGAIERYVTRLPPGSLVVNDVFPEPHVQVLERFRERQVGIVHLAGVRATVIPRLPFGYRGAVPCCAIHAPDSAELVLKQLV